MHAFWEIVVSNALLVAALAVGVALLGRIWKNPMGLHLLWLLVLLKLITPPLVTVPVPLPVRQAALASAEHEEEMATVAANRHEHRALEERAIPRNTTPSTESAVSPSVTQQHGVSWLTIVAWTWGAGIVAVGFRQAFRMLRFLKLLHAAEVPSAAVLGMALETGKRLGLRNTPEIRMLPVCISPLVWSLSGRAQVLLPTELFKRLDVTAQHAILAHELAHVRRKDHLIRLLELLSSTLFWWHPVVWWACRELQELEDQCCDAMVVGVAGHSLKTYANALLDTLDFLAERSIVAPLGATATTSSVVLTRRIAMLKNPVCAVHLTFGRLMLLAVVAAVPMTLAFAAKPPKADDRSSQDAQTSGEQPGVQRRVVNRPVKDFPEKTDLSTPESALAAFNRGCASMDAKAIADLSWRKGPRQLREIERFPKRDPKEIAMYVDAALDGEVVEVYLYRENLAVVVSMWKLPKGVSWDPYSARYFGRIDGQWKNFGEDRFASVQAAREAFETQKDGLWKEFVAIRDNVKGGRSAPDLEEERLIMMGRVEDFLMHNFRDVTARKSREWGEVQADEQGNRSIRYMYEARIWDRESQIMNQVFTFDSQGKFVRYENVEGFPKKKVEKPVDVGTKEGMQELVEDFFHNNYRDITSRETIEWGEVTKAENGTSSIRYKFRAKIWDKETKIMNKVFTFDPKGKFVSVKDVDE